MTKPAYGKHTDQGCLRVKSSKKKIWTSTLKATGRWRQLHNRKLHCLLMRYEVFMVANITTPLKIKVFWNVMQVGNIYQCFEGLWHLHLQGQEVNLFKLPDPNDGVTIL
jgi:hypothetical protein